MMKIFGYSAIVVTLAVLAFGAVPSVYAQDAAPAAATPADPNAPAAAPTPEEIAAEKARQEILHRPFTQSLLFTPLEIATLQMAQAGKQTTTAPLKASEGGTYIPPRRVITLSGVLFRKSGDWIAWINGQKILPKALLPEIVDISVSKDIVHLKWYDIGMNKIISISMRPHQTYDIVTGIMLPGG